MIEVRRNCVRHGPPVPTVPGAVELAFCGANHYYNTDIRDRAALPHE